MAGPDLGDLPLDLREVFRREVAWRVSSGVNVHTAEYVAELIVRRRHAWAMRRVDAKPCSTCKVLVLWRKESGVNVPVDETGYRHLCKVRW